MSEIIKPEVIEVVTMSLQSNPVILKNVEAWLADNKIIVANEDRWDANGGRHWRCHFTDGAQALRFRAAFAQIVNIARSGSGKN